MSIKVIIRLHQNDSVTKWETTVFEGEEEVEQIGQLLNNLSKLDSVFFKLTDGSKLFMTKNLIDQCTFTLVIL